MLILSCRAVECHSRHARILSICRHTDLIHVCNLSDRYKANLDETTKSAAGGVNRPPTMLDDQAR